MRVISFSPEMRVTSASKCPFWSASVKVSPVSLIMAMVDPAGAEPVSLRVSVKVT